MSHHCHARQFSDQMVCRKCGLVWDMNDPDPPQCNHGVRVTLDSKSTESGKTNQQHNPEQKK